LHNRRSERLQIPVRNYQLEKGALAEICSLSGDTQNEMRSDIAGIQCRFRYLNTSPIQTNPMRAKAGGKIFGVTIRQS
jgi:hypothetical protein